MNIKIALLAFSLGLSTSVFAADTKTEDSTIKSEYCMYEGKEYSEGAFLNDKKCVKKKTTTDIFDKNGFNMI